MNLQQLLLTPVLRPKVVHRLPGRLRIHLPALQRLPKDDVGLLGLIEAVLTVPLEIETARACSASGNILLTYDAKRVGEDEVIGYVHGIARMLSKHWKSIAALPQSELVARRDRWVAAVKSAIRYRLELDEDVEVPTDDLA